jgi:hypothetical protein
MWSWKPFAGCNAPRTPIDSFYIAQSGGIANYTTLTAGQMAAVEVMNGLSMALPEWWNGVAFQGARELLARQGAELRFTVD